MVFVVLVPADGRFRDGGHLQPCSGHKEHPSKTLTSDSSALLPENRRQTRTSSDKDCSFFEKHLDRQIKQASDRGQAFPVGQAPAPNQHAPGMKTSRHPSTSRRRPPSTEVRHHARQELVEPLGSPPCKSCLIVTESAAPLVGWIHAVPVGFGKKKRVHLPSIRPLRASVGDRLGRSEPT